MPTDGARYPDDPREELTRWWTFIKDPQNSSSMMAIFTVVIAVATVFYAAVSVAQWCAMRDAISASRESQRAWVGITDPMVKSVRYGGDWVQVTGELRLRNFGLSPAFKVYPLVILGQDINRIDEIAKSACAGSKEAFDFTSSNFRQANQNREQGNTIFPSQDIPYNFQASETLTKSRLPGGLWAVGCMYYRDVLGNTRYTEFCLFTSDVARANGEAFQRCSMYEKAE